MSLEEKNGEWRWSGTSAVIRNGVPGRRKNRIKGVIKHVGENHRWSFTEKDTGGNATKSTILAVGINSKGKLWASRW